MFLIRRDKSFVSVTIENTMAMADLRHLNRSFYVVVEIFGKQLFMQHVLFYIQVIYKSICLLYFFRILFAQRDKYHVIS